MFEPRSCVIKLVSSTSALELVNGPAWFVLDCNLKQRQEKLFSNHFLDFQALEMSWLWSHTISIILPFHACITKPAVYSSSQFSTSDGRFCTQRLLTPRGRHNVYSSSCWWSVMIHHKFGILSQSDFNIYLLQDEFIVTKDHKHTEQTVECMGTRSCDFRTPFSIIHIMVLILIPAWCHCDLVIFTFDGRKK